MHDVRLLDDETRSASAAATRSSRMEICCERKNSHGNGFSQVNTATCAEKAVQYMETDRCGVTATKDLASR